MLRHARCVLLKFLNHGFIIINYLFDLLFEPDPILNQIKSLNFLEKYLFLKNPHEAQNSIKKFYRTKNRQEKFVRKSKSLFESLDHNTRGANFHVFNYRHNEIQDLIWQMKFKDHKQISKIFGFCLAKEIYEIQKRSAEIERIFNNPFLLVPMPIHYRRFLERGYNQCDWLCLEILNSYKRDKKLGQKSSPFSKKFLDNVIYHKGILKRIKYTKKQSQTINRNRSKNVEYVFGINQKKVKKYLNLQIILIDDVFTTGATIIEACNTLKKSGFKKIISLTIAR